MGGRAAFAALAPLLLVLQVVHGYSWTWSGTGGENCQAPDSEDFWCCTREHCPEAENGQTCPEIPIPLTNSCEGKCYHDRTYTFVSACENSTICVQDLNVCNGIYATYLGERSCPDRSDLNWCREPERKQEKCPGEQWFGLTLPDPTPKVRCEGGIPGQCVEKQKTRDGTTYDCIDRSDEPLVLKSSASLDQEPLNLKHIQTCSNMICVEWEHGWEGKCVREHQESGLKCGDECVRMSEWCKQSTARQCSDLNNLSTTDPELCSNFSFWASKDCGPPNFYRCSGSWSGQCGDHGKLDDRAYDGKIAELHPRTIGKKCIDKSDQFWLVEAEKQAETWDPKECTTSKGEPGLACFGAPDQRCLELTKWCNRFNTEMERVKLEPLDEGIGYTPKAPTIYQCGPGKSNTSLSISICSNSTLMSSAPCPGNAKRCTGSYMECMPDKNSAQCVD